MIQVYSGTPGSGKSLHTAHEIRTYLNVGKNVISTCAIDTDLCFLNIFKRWYVNHFNRKPKKIKHNKKADNFHYIDIMEITPEYLYRFAAKHHVFGKEHQTIVFLDECVAIFSPTVISDNKEQWNAWDTFFRKHRHIGFDVVLIPQSKKLIARKVLEYCEYEVKHYNRKNQGFLGWLLSLFVGGSLFSSSTLWRGTRGKPLEQSFFTYKPLYGLMYNSYSMYDDTLAPYKAELKREEEEKKQLIGTLLLTLNERVKELEKSQQNC